MACIVKRQVKNKPSRDGYKRAGVVFDVYYTYYDAENNKKRTSKKSILTEKEANAFKTKVEHDVASGKYIHETNMKLSELMQEWLESIEPSVAPNTYRGYRTNVNNHIIPGIGKVHLSKLNLAKIQRFYNSLGKDGKDLSPATIKYVHRNLCSALDYGVNRDLISRNDSKLAKRPKVVRPEKSIYTAREILTLIGSTEDTSIQCIIAIAGFMGLRRAEILGLRFNKDIDLENKCITVRGQITKNNKKYSFSTTKTVKSKRKIYMPDIVYNLVKRQKSNQLKLIDTKGLSFNKNKLLFCREDGDFYSFDTLHHKLKKSFKKSGLKEITCQELRHSCASLAILNDVNIKVVSEMLGHSNISITADTYMHVIDEKRKEAANSIDSVIKSVSNDK